MDLTTKGLRLDVQPNEIDEGSWVWAKNILIANGYKSIRNEDGFKETYYIADSTYKIIGNCPAGDRIVLFSVGSNASKVATTISFSENTPANDTILDSANGFVTAGFKVGMKITVSGTISNNGTYTISGLAPGTLTLIDVDDLTNESAGSSFAIVANGLSRIEVIDLEGTIIPMIDSSGVNRNLICTSQFGFSITYPIETVYKYNYKGDLIVAWTDNYNRPFILNLSNLPFVLNSDGYISTPTAISGEIVLADRYAELARLFPYFRPIQLSVYDVIDGGGSIPEGGYCFVGAYTIDEYGITIVSPPSEQVHIAATGFYKGTPNTGNGGIVKTSVAGEDVNKIVKLSFNVVNYPPDKIFSTVKVFAIGKTEGTLGAALIYQKETAYLNYASNNYIYYNGTVIEKVDINELIIPKFTFKLCKTLDSLDDRLITGNITYNDDLALTSLANNITVTWNYDKNANNPCVSLPLDEVLALYLVGVYKDGSQSEGYHIPGRATSTITYGLVSITDATIKMAAVNLTPGGTYSVVRVTVTPTITTSLWGDDVIAMNKFDSQFSIVGDGNVSYNGTGGSYMECRLHYTAPGTGNLDLDVYDVDYTGVVNVYDITVIGNTLGYTFDTAYLLYAGGSEPENRLVCEWAFCSPNELLLNTSYTKIFHVRDTSNVTGYVMGYWENSNETYYGSSNRVRHHKTPSLKTVQTTGEYVHGRLSLTISTFVVDTTLLSKISGYYIAYAKRRINNSCITGYSPILEHDWYTVPCTIRNTIRFYDYTLLTAKPALQPAFVKLYYYRNKAILPIDDARFDYIDTLAPVHNSTQQIEECNYIPADNSSTSPNNNAREEYLQLRVNSVANNISVLDNYKYYIGSLCNLVLDAYSPYYQQTLVGLSRTMPVESTGTYNTVTGDYAGDIYFSIHKFILQTGDLGALGANRYFHSLFSFNIYNSEWRETYYDPSMVWLEEGTGSGAPAGSLAILYYNDYKYNTDLASLNELGLPSPYNPSVDYISKDTCEIRRSKVMGNEDKDVKWREFLALDKHIMQRNRGNIFVIRTMNKNLAIITDRALYIAQLKDKLATNTFETYLGLGDIFDRPADEIIPNEGGYINCRSRYTCKVTAIGLIIVDVDYGKVWLYNNTLTELTNTYVREFFKNRLNLYGYTDNPYGSIGTTIGYNDENKIVLLTTKRRLYINSGVNTYTFGINMLVGSKYKITITNSTASSFPINVLLKDGIVTKDTFVINNADIHLFYHIPITTYTDANISTTNIFNVILEQGYGDCTTSYNIETKQWISLHDYIPNDYIINNKKLFSIINVNSYNSNYPDVFRHNNNDKKGTYYDIAANYSVNESYVDLVFNMPIAIDKVLEAIIYQTDIVDYLGVNLYNKTITDIMLYNDTQCTGKLPLDSTLDWFDNSETIAVNQDRYFNNIEDMVNSNVLPIIDNDKNIVTYNVNSTIKDWFDKSKFISKFVIVRLYFDNATYLVGSTRKQYSMFINEVGAIFRQNFR